MIKLPFKPHLLVIAGSFVVMSSGGLLLSSSVAARDGSDNTTTQQAVRNRTASELQRDAEMRDKLEQQKKDNEAKVAEAKLRVCHAREKAVNNIMDRVAGRETKKISVLSQITEKVKAFADSHKKPANYDALVADVNAKKAAAEATANVVKSSSLTFRCDDGQLEPMLRTLRPMYRRKGQL